MEDFVVAEIGSEYSAGLRKIFVYDHAGHVIDKEDIGCEGDCNVVVFYTENDLSIDARAVQSGYDPVDDKRFSASNRYKITSLGIEPVQ